MRHSFSRAFSLLEVLVASAILAVLLLATASLMITLQRANAHTGASIDMDQQIRTVLTQLRSDIRQSGFDSAGNSQITLAPATGVVAQIRIRTGMDLAITNEDGTTTDIRTDHTARLSQNWQRRVTYRLVEAATIPRPGGTLTTYDLLKTTEEGDPLDPVATDVPIATNIAAFTLTDMTPNDGASPPVYTSPSLEFEAVIEAARTNPDWSGGGTPEPIRFKLTERLRAYNRTPLAP